MKTISRFVWVLYSLGHFTWEMGHRPNIVNTWPAKVTGSFRSLFRGRYSQHPHCNSSGHLNDPLCWKGLFNFWMDNPQIAQLIPLKNTVGMQARMYNM